MPLGRNYPQSIKKQLKMAQNGHFRVTFEVKMWFQVFQPCPYLWLPNGGQKIVQKKILFFGQPSRTLSCLVVKIELKRTKKYTLF